MVSQFERRQLWLISKRDLETEENYQLCIKNLTVQVLTNRFFMYDSNCLLYFCLQPKFAVLFREKSLKNLWADPHAILSDN
jgi:hypothetical protein